MNAWPAYSPDGRKICFGSSRTGDFEIYVMNADGSDSRSLDTQPGAGRPPRLVSRRNAHRVHQQPRRKLRDLRHERRRIESAQRQRHTPPATTIAAWHPDGRLLFVSDRDGGSDLYLTRMPEYKHAKGTVNASPRRPTGGINP